MKPEGRRLSIDIVVPVYDEEQVVAEFHRGLMAVVTPLRREHDVRIHYVNDGSADQTGAELLKLAADDPDVTILELSRNFGHQAALTAGLDRAEGDAVVTLDGDGQHPPELIETAELDPPAVHVETAAFAAKALAERLMARLGTLGLTCTRVMIEAETERGERLTRCWRHEGALTPAALAARVRWQLEGWLTADTAGDDGSVDELATSGLVLLRLVPDEVLPATGRQLGFWGGDPAAADRAGRVLARVQGMLGHPAVVTAVPQGGRTPGERVRWVPWGDPREPARLLDAVPAPGASVREVPPWPGAIPAPAPARVFEPPPPAELLDAAGEVVTVSGRGDPSAPPARLRCATLHGGGGEIAAWAGPWAHDARWWDRRARTRRAYWQVLVAAPDGERVACLVAVTAGHAALEAIYD